MSVIEFENNHGVTAAGAFDGVVAKSVNNGISPGGEGHISPSFFTRDRSADQVISISMAGIDAIVANHLKMFFRDMTNETLNKIHGRNSFGDEFVIFMAVVVEGDSIIHYVIGVNTGSSDDRTPEISANVFKNLVGITFVRFQINIEPIFRTYVDLGFNFFELWRKFLLEKI